MHACTNKLSVLHFTLPNVRLPSVESLLRKINKDVILPLQKALTIQATEISLRCSALNGINKPVTTTSPRPVLYSTIGNSNFSNATVPCRNQNITQLPRTSAVKLNSQYLTHSTVRLKRISYRNSQESNWTLNTLRLVFPLTQHPLLPRKLHLPVLSLNF